MSRTLVSVILGAITVSCNAPPILLPVVFPIEAQTPENAMKRAPNYERLASLRGWEDQESVRRRWLFLAERDAFDWFGAPDRVSPHAGSAESWHYSRYTEDNYEKYVLEFSRGRLLGVDSQLLSPPIQDREPNQDDS